MCLSWWQLRQRGNLRLFLARDAVKITILTVISLAVFGLWFLLDPNPQAIWRDFILGENLGKFETKGGGYLTKLLWGQSSIWRLVVSYPLNAGLLAFPVTLLFWVALKRRRQLDQSEKLLWIWIAALFLFFSLPSQRDERYLLPGMPALAVLCALNWHRITRWAFAASLAVLGAGVGVAAYLSVRLEQGMAEGRLYPAPYWLLLAGIEILVVLALYFPWLTRPGATAGALLGSLALATFMRPLDGRIGTYDAEAQAYARGKPVWVPINFRAKEEAHRFFLPGADVRAYHYDPALTADKLSARYPLFVFRLPLAAPPPAGLRIIGQRLDIGSRHNSRQIMEMVRGRVFEHLFIKELLLAAPGTNGPPAQAAATAAR